MQFIDKLDYRYKLAKKYLGEKYFIELVVLHQGNYWVYYHTRMCPYGTTTISESFQKEAHDQ